MADFCMIFLYPHIQNVRQRRQIEFYARADILEIHIFSSRCIIHNLSAKDIFFSINIYKYIVKHNRVLSWL